MNLTTDQAQANDKEQESITFNPQVMPHTHHHVKAHVEVVDIKDYKKAAKTLQIAFKDDLYVRYLTSGITDPKMKEQLNLALFEATVYSTILSGLVVCVRDVEGEKEDPNVPFLAVACFEKPRPVQDFESTSLVRSLWSMYQGGYLKFIWLANKEIRKRVLFEQSEMLEKFRYDVLDDEFATSWYLSDIGAIPKGRKKGLARALVDYVCQNYIDKSKPKTDGSLEEDEDDKELRQLEERSKGRSSTHNPTTKSNTQHNDDESQLESEIQSYNFSFDLDSDNFTDYSGYSSISDSDVSSAHSSWYYNEDEDILAQYDKQKSRGSQSGAVLYLESSHPRNRKIYERLGFVYVKTVEIAKVTDKHGHRKTLTMDLMVRGIKGARWIKKNSN